MVPNIGQKIPHITWEIFFKSILDIEKNKLKHTSLVAELSQEGLFAKGKERHGSFKRDFLTQY